jgi:hypothetical protein
MGRSFSRKHSSDVETARETFIPAAPGSSMPRRTDRETQRLMVQANICHDGQNDDIAEKKHRYK